MKELKAEFEAISRCLFRMFAMTHASADASDLVQETLLRVLQLIRNGKYQSDRSSLKTFSYGVAFNIRKEFSRRRRLTLVDDEKDLEAEYGVDYEQQQDIRKLRATISNCSSQEQDILALLLDQDLTHSEISGVLEIPLGTIKSHIHRAKEKIKEQMNSTGGVYEERKR